MEPLKTWPPMPDKPQLFANDVHVWFASLDFVGFKVDKMWSLLSLDERDKASQYHLLEDRNRFVFIRGLLRMILGYYLAVSPQQITFCYGLYGKPYLQRQLQRSAIQFNLAHAGKFALYSIARDRHVGVDVEYMRPIPEAFQLIERFFCSKEKIFLCNLSEDEFIQTFFQFWTRKEAFIKARGQGLSFPLTCFDISSVSKTPVLYFDEDSGKKSSWTFRDLFFNFDYAASLVVEGEEPLISCWRWDY